MDPGTLAAIFTGFAALLTAAGGITANRARRTAVSRREFRATQRRILIALAHIFRLESDLAERGAPVPARPAGLDDDDEDDPPAIGPAGGARYAGG